MTMRAPRLLLIPLAFAFLAACATPPASSPPLSPRESADPILTSYAAVLVAVHQAVTSPLLAGEPDVKARIKASSHAASAAVLAYGDLAANCFRHPATAQVGDAIGRHCDMDGLTIARTEAQTLINQTSALVSAFGFRPAAVPADPIGREQ
jgi:hypothetical protein